MNKFLSFFLDPMGIDIFAPVTQSFNLLWTAKDFEDNRNHCQVMIRLKRMLRQDKPNCRFSHFKAFKQVPAERRGEGGHTGK